MPVMASRYSGSRYDGDSRRSRSRDRSPDRRSLYSDGGPRRSSAESRSNSTAFQTNRDSFRDALPRDPPRGPKALLDVPSGPRGGGYSGDFRGRGRGRGRVWRDDSRDRGRDRDIDFRDRRDNSYRDERSRERDRGDWRDRDRDSFRGRRLSPRGRSPPGRDFRDAREMREMREAQLGVDADRARRASKDGPLSAGSSSSDPPFGPSSYRGGYGNRGRGRGRGDFRGRGFYDDRDRYGSTFRSRSQEGRYRDRDDRDRDNRYLEPELRQRDHRDDRDMRDREARPKIERASHEPPPLPPKDVSPPPIAPAAPSFGSVPNRAPTADVASATGKAPPTGPRALKDERQPPPPLPTSTPTSDARLPPMGPSRSSYIPDINTSTIPSGPRSQTRPGPSSKQWINPNIKNRAPESPKMNRSQSIAQPQPTRSRPDGSHPDQLTESEQRPGSSDAKANPPLDSVDRQVHDSHAINSTEEPTKSEQQQQSARLSSDQVKKPQDAPMNTDKDEGEVERTDNVLIEPPVTKMDVVPATDEAKPKPKPKSDRRPTLKVLPKRISLPQKEVNVHMLDQSSESDDEEFGDVIESQMSEVESKLKELEAAEDTVPMNVIVQHAIISLEAVAKIMNEPEGIESMIGPIPDNVSLPGKAPVEPEPEPEPETQPGPKSELVQEPKPETEPELELEQEPVPMPELEPVRIPEPEPEQEREQEQEQEREQEKEREQEHEPGPEPEPEPKPAPQIEKQIDEQAEAQVEKPPSAEQNEDVDMDVDTKGHTKEKTPLPVLEEPHLAATETEKPSAELPQPSIEQDVDLPITQGAPQNEKKPEGDDGDVTMEDVLDASQADSELQAPLRTQLPTSRVQSTGLPLEETQIRSQDISKRGSSAPSPTGEDDDETDIEDVDLQTIEIIREHMPTPSIDSLPYFDEKPWFQDRAFLKSMDATQSSVNAFILEKLKDEAWNRMVEETKMKQIYDANYDHYLRFTMSDDPVAVKSREKFEHAVKAEYSSQKAGFHDSKLEGRRSRYASERDLERILEESRRVEDEKRERKLQAERERYRTEKEAVLPRQYQTEEERENDFFRDVNGFIPAEKTVAAWQLLPPVDNFTEEETAIFEKAYLEFPKQWGRVSEPIPNRDFGTSIQFYYLKKEKDELNLKEKLKKRPKQRKKGGRKQRSSALVSELGNKDTENEENQETGENGERRRPRRAAAPTFNSEATPATDGESGTPSGTPGRRGAGAKGDGTEKKPRGRRAAKDKEAKQPRVNQTLAAAPPASTKGNRSRSSSRAVHAPEWASQPTPNEAARASTQYELVSSTTAAVPHIPISAPFPSAQPILSPERGVPPPPAPPISMPLDTMGPPPLRPEPPQQQPQIAIPDLGQVTASDRRSGSQASSYWSVPEATDFPQLLRSFGSDWSAIATHMRTKTPIMIKNYYTRKKDSHDWQNLVEEADAQKARGEKRPAPPAPSSGVKKRYETSGNRPLAAADTVMEDSPAPKLEHSQGSQPVTGRFNVPIAAQPQPTLIQSPFVPTTQPQMIQSHGATPPAPQSLTHPVTQTMSPRPTRAPFSFPEREREISAQQQVRLPLGQKQPQQGPPPTPESSMGRHPLPGPMIEPQLERPKAESKMPKEQPRHQDRQQLRVKQEPDLIHQYDHFVPQAPPVRMVSRPDSVPLSRPPDPPRAVAPAPQMSSQSSFATILQQQHGRSLLGEGNPSPPIRHRPISSLSRPPSGAGSGVDPFSAPPAQLTPPAVAPPPSRPPERKTSSLMALLNDDPPPPPPKRIVEVPAAVKPSSTPPPQSNLSRPPPPPPPPSQVRRESVMPPESQGYRYSQNPPPAPSAMPPLKPYASPQAQHMNAPRHMALEATAERDYYGGRPRSFPSAHQSPVTGSPQTPHHYPPNQPPQMSYQPQPSYPYGAQVPPPHAASPPPQYGGHAAPRGHEHQSSRDMGWPGPHQGHPLQQQQPPPPPQQAAWASHPPQPPKTSQAPSQSAWAAQQPTPKPPPPSSSVPPQPSWASAPPRGHDPMALRDVRDVYPPHRMQPPLQAQYAPASRAPEPPPPQAPAAYPRYASTPGPGRDPRDPGPPRTYTPVSAYDNRGYPPPPSTQDIREAQLREQQHQHQQQQQQQQSMFPQQLRQPPPPDRHSMYDRPPPDRYGR
ncbi:hypothetical protein M426DRAFT_23699 [Hypoxylon sp. CI-4A]|nr:hypothetical protein M426DRAFT_23699 [Hypoxylon sp. CI-4A]